MVPRAIMGGNAACAIARVNSHTFSYQLMSDAPCGSCIKGPGFIDVGVPGAVAEVKTCTFHRYNSLRAGSNLIGIVFSDRDRLGLVSRSTFTGYYTVERFRLPHRMRAVNRGTFCSS